MKMRRLLCIVGPTATGKTDAAISLAKRLNGEVVGADSMQIYRDVRIASAKPSPDEMGGVPYHLIDCVDINEPYSAARYQQTARTVISEVNDQGKLPILTGGTGLYINAVLYDMKFAEAGNDYAYRESLLALERETPGSLHRLLAEIDPAAAFRLNPNDVKRIVRALEVLHTSGEAISRVNAGYKDKRLYDALVFGLTYPREVLYRRIERRVDRMMEEGLTEEIASLRAKAAAETTGLKFLGYKEIGAYLDGEIPLDEAVMLLKRNSRRYAKRQMTWFRHMKDIKWVDLSCFESIDGAVSCIMKQIKEKWEEPT